jgi:hypothetical protein
VSGPERPVGLAERVAALEVELSEFGAHVDDVRAGNPLRPGQSPPGGPVDPEDPGGGAEPVRPFYGSLLEFVTEGFAPVYCRATSPTVRWCATWWDHAEAIYRLEALWRTWELYRLEPRLGIASWLRDYLDPQLAALTSPTGPFAQCTDDRHSPLKALRTQYPPEGYFEDL